MVARKLNWFKGYKLYAEKRQFVTRNMVLIRGEISLNSPTALGKFRNRANSMNGIFCNIVLTKIIKPIQAAKYTNESLVNNSCTNLESMLQTHHEKQEKQEIPVVINEKSINKKLGRIVYTTKEGDTFEAYHSIVFPKIVCDGIVYDNKDSWRGEMVKIVVEPRRLY